MLSKGRGQILLYSLFAENFVRKGGGGGTPQIRNSLFAENFVRKEGEGGTPHIRNLFFGPKTGVFWAKNTIFGTFRRTFFGGMSVKGEGGGYPPNPYISLLRKFCP